MATYTMTIAQILKSLIPQYEGFKTKEELQYGDYLSPHEVIEKSYKQFFDRMRLNEYVNNDFKIQFLLRFYNDEIAFETVTPFFTRLETILNNDCYQILRLSDEIRTATLDKIIRTQSIKNVGTNRGNTNTSSKGKGSNIGLLESTPETDKNITFNFDAENFSLIKYTNQIEEQHNKNQNVVESRTTGDMNSTAEGFGGIPYMDLLNSVLRFTEPYTQVFNECEGRLFMQIY